MLFIVSQPTGALAQAAGLTAVASGHPYTPATIADRILERTRVIAVAIRERPCFTASH